MEEKDLITLAQNPLFRGIGKEELGHILGCLKPSLKIFEKGEYITHEGDAFNGIGIVLEGRVKVTKNNEAGERIILSLLERGDLFGEMVAFASVSIWPATVIADGKSKVILLKPEAIISQCSHVCIGHRQLSINLLNIISDKAIHLNRKVHYLSIKSMRGRLAKYLMEQYHLNGNKTFFEIPFNRNELAEFLHVSRPSMSRELAKMKEEGILDFHQKTFRLKEVDLLSDYASHLV